MSDFAIVRHTKTNRLYKYHGNDSYTNLFTGAKGIIPPEQAQRIFKINLEATAILNEYPMVEEMIRRLKLVDGRHTDEQDKKILAQC